MPSCGGAMTARCTGEPVGDFQLVNVGVRPLCGECLEVATDLGMAPQRIPSWLARGRRGENRAKETTGAPA
jgi:hypothetical protein